MTTDDIIRMATLAGARPGFDNQADLSFLQDFAALVADAATAPLHARIAELEAMLDAVGAGGVGQSIKPQVQADTAPAAWAICSDDGTAIRLWSRDKATAQEAADKFGRPLVPLYTAPHPTENLRCKSTQKRLATLWGYVKPQHLQPLTEDEIYECERIAAIRHQRHKHSIRGQQITPADDLQWHFARAVEAAHGITGGQL